MSDIGWKSASQASHASIRVWSSQGWPVIACSTWVARFGVAAMPPKAMRAPVTMPSSTVMLKAPQTAEMSWSKRLDSL